jgi:hypothetical membrane protein
MKPNQRVFAGGLFLLCAAQLQCTLGPGLSTPEDRARVVTLVRSLEQNPLAEDAPAARQWLSEWIVDVPDIRFHVCEDLIAQGLGDDYPYANEVTSQAMFSAAAFAIEHPDQVRNRSAQYYEGVQGALRVYESLVKTTPDASSAFLDDLLAKRDSGQLADHLAALARERCKQSHDFLLAHLLGGGVALVLGLLVGWGFGGGRAGWVAVLTGARDGRGEKAKALQWLVFFCAAYFVIVVAILHLLHPEYDPRFWFMSGYAMASYGWLMSTNFVALGTALLLVGAALLGSHPATLGGRLGSGLLVVAGVFVYLAGVFKDSLPHLLAGAVAFPSMVMGVLLLSWSFRQAAGWRRIFPLALLIALVMLAAFLLMAGEIGMPGVEQRVFIFLLLVWLSIAIHRFARLRTARSGASA